MKNTIFKIFLVMVLMATVSSCKKNIGDFLETPPSLSLDENVIFNSQATIEQYIESAYLFSIPSFMQIRDPSVAVSPTGSVPGQQLTLFASATDEAESSASYGTTQPWNIGDVSPITILSREDYMYFARFRGIRIANHILEKIDTSPVGDTFKAQAKAEAKFLRAMNNFEMFKRYGGIQIIDKRISPFEGGTIPRSTLKQTVDFIVKDCDEAFALLPAGFPTASQKGRVNKSSILALKSRTLLYAASPLFNTATPYISFDHNELICYGNEDKERWKLAVDAAKAAISQASAEGFVLLDNPAKRNPAVVNGTSVIINGVPTLVGGQLLGNYRESWEIPDNDELILSFKGFPSAGSYQFPWQHLLPSATPGFGGFYAGPAPTHTFVKYYEKKDGTSQNWQVSGNDLVQKYSELDSRFAQTIAFNGSRFSSNIPIIETFVGGTHTLNNPTGYWMKKLIPDALYNSGNAIAIISVFRFNELLLNLAEASNEYTDQPSSEAYDAINKIRTRSGMPNFPPNLSKIDFRTKIQNERAIELSFENYRFWDLRRWLIADKGYMNGSIKMLTITKILPFTGQFRYVESELEPRTFYKQEYLHPFQRDEVLKNPSLIQNPGW